MGHYRRKEKPRRIGNTRRDIAEQVQENMSRDILKDAQGLEGKVPLLFGP